VNVPTSAPWPIYWKVCRNRLKTFCRQCGTSVTFLLCKRKSKVTCIYIVLYNAISLKRSDMTGMQQGNHAPATHTRTIPACTSKPQSVIALWLVLIALINERMVRLSWPGRLVIYRGRSRAPRMEPGHGRPSQYTNRARRRLTSLIETTGLLLRQTATYTCFIPVMRLV